MMIKEIAIDIPARPRIIEDFVMLYPILPIFDK